MVKNYWNPYFLIYKCKFSDSVGNTYKRYTTISNIKILFENCRFIEQLNIKFSIKEDEHRRA